MKNGAYFVLNAKLSERTAELFRRYVSRRDIQPSEAFRRLSRYAGVAVEASDRGGYIRVDSMELEVDYKPPEPTELTDKLSINTSEQTQEHIWQVIFHLRGVSEAVAVDWIIVHGLGIVAAFDQGADVMMHTTQGGFRMWNQEAE